MRDIYQVRTAVVDDMQAIIGLINEAAEWLRTKGTDQWANPWPDNEARDGRVLRDLQAGRTWIVHDNSDLVGTITYGQEGSEILWTPDERRSPAVYICRLVISRQCGGREIGAALINWAGKRGRQNWKAEFIRADVWTLNFALHNYYKNEGFTHVRTCDFKDPWEYPSAALFQKPTAEIDQTAAALFKELNSASTDAAGTLSLQP
jgi:hypothetical protein